MILVIEFIPTTFIFLDSQSVCVVSVVRATQIRTVSDEDVSWTAVIAVMWSGIEINIGVVSACLPTLRPIFTSVLRGHQRVTSQAKHGTISQGETEFGLRSFKKHPTQGYGELDRSTDMRGSRDRDESFGNFQREWEISSTARTDGRIEDDWTPVRPQNAIMVTTELDVRHFPAGSGGSI